MTEPLHVTWGYIASGEPMGQQRYENELQSELARIADPRKMVFHSTPIKSMRSSLPSGRRAPAGLLNVLPYRPALAIGHLTWRTRGVVHRFDTRLPPYAGSEVLTVHDMAQFRFPDEGRPSRAWRQSILRASCVIAPSNFSATEISERTGRRDIVVAHNGVSRGFVGAPRQLEAEELTALGLTVPFVLSVGGMTERKNMGALARAWAAVGPHLGMTLALAGPPDSRRNALFGGLPGVTLLGRVPDALLPSLFTTAALVVSPSLYEGFGLPCLEAMAVGTPVLAVRSGAAKEICGDAALLVGPSAAELAEGLEAILSPGGPQRELAAAGRIRSQSFTWERSAHLHIAAYESAALHG